MHDATNGYALRSNSLPPFSYVAAPLLISTSPGAGHSGSTIVIELLDDADHSPYQSPVVRLGDAVCAHSSSVINQQLAPATVMAAK